MQWCGCVHKYLCLTALLGTARTLAKHLVMTFLVYCAVAHYTKQTANARHSDTQPPPLTL